MRYCLPDLAFLKECFACDAERGRLIWKTRPAHHFSSERSTKIWNTKFAGNTAGKTGTDGFNRTSITIDGVRFSVLVHRVVWALTKGKWPDHHIVPDNGIRSDDRPVNLREVTRTRIMQTRGPSKSNKLGFKGVSRNKNKFEARIMRDGRGTHLGDLRRG
jgi:hypothetical protein